MFIQDFIEQEPLTIDLKIEGIQKLKNIPIEQVGVHSFRALGLCQVAASEPSVHFCSSGHTLESIASGGSAARRRKKEKAAEARLSDKPFKEVQRPINIIVNVKSHGRRRMISFES